jgi:hypothetical protein
VLDAAPSPQRWLESHPEVTGFVILDDAEGMAHLASRHVQTQMGRGLEDEHVGAAVRLTTRLPFRLKLARAARRGGEDG